MWSYLQAKKVLHGLQILGKVAPNQSSPCLVARPNIRVELVEVFLKPDEDNFVGNSIYCY